MTKAQEKRENAVKESLLTIAEAVDSFIDTDEFYEWMRKQARFHRYSARNVMLIRHYFGDTPEVGTYKQWEQRGRRVRTGEHGAYLLKPLPIPSREKELPDGTTKVVPSFVRFGTFSAFAYEQTDPIEGAKNVWEPRQMPKVQGELAQDVYDALVELALAESVKKVPSDT